MAFMAMSFFISSFSFSQSSFRRTFASNIQTPDTSKELSLEDEERTESEKEEKTVIKKYVSSPRGVQRHGFGFGLGETFLMGNYSKYGNDKITLDLLYTYAASYSFDLLVNAHMSEHEDENERMKLLGLSSSIKARFVEFDNLSPYFLGGLGFYAPRAKRNFNNSRSWSDQKVTFGMNFGGGIDLRLNDHYVVGVMGQLHWPFTVQQNGQSDLKGYYFKLLLTGMYLF